MIIPGSGVIGHLPNPGWTVNGGSVTFGSDGVSFLLAAATYANSGGPVSVIDPTFGNVFIPLTERASLSGDAKCRMWYVPNPITGIPHTITFSGLNSFIQGIIFTFFGTLSLNPLDLENSNAIASGVSIQPGVITPIEDFELVVSVASYSDFSTIDSFSGFNVPFNNPISGSDGISGQRFPIGFGFKIQTGKSSENPTWVWSPTAGACATIASFKAAPIPPFSSGVDAKRI